MVDCPRELRQLYHEHRLIPFVGAGVSMSVAWDLEGRRCRGPSWQELVDQAAKELGFEDPGLLRFRGTDLHILEYFKLMQSGQTARLTNWLFASMRPPDDALRESPVHRQLVEMKNCILVYTTNYDDFIERSFTICGEPYVVVASESHMGARSDVRQIVKFHGDLNNPNKMVLTESDYQRRLTLSDELDYRLQADILGRAMLFLGYNFRDWNVSYLFRLVNDRFHNLPGTPTGRRAYIVVADPSDFEMKLFYARNIEVIAVRRQFQTEDTAELLEKLQTGGRTMIDRITYGTSSSCKREEANVFLAHCILPTGMKMSERFEFDFRSETIPELLETDIEIMVRYEAKDAYGQVRVPCIVEHAGLIFCDLKEKTYPGGLTKPMWDALGPDWFVHETQSAGRRAIARSVVAYCDGMKVRAVSELTESEGIPNLDEF